MAPAAPLCFSPTRSRIELAASPFHTIALLLSLCAANGAGAKPGRKKQETLDESDRMRKAMLSIAAAAVALASILAIGPGASSADTADTVPSGTLRNVAGIVTHRDGRVVQVGTAFFVAVPSAVFPGRSFVYLVTAHHNLLDDGGNPRAGLLLTLEDSRTGAMREEPLPLESRWVLDP